MATAHAQATANGRFGHREIIRFTANVPTLLTLDHDDGTPSPGAYGDQWRYTCNNGKAVMWVDPAVRDLIRASGASQGDEICITRHQQGKGRARWSVEKVEEEPQPAPAVPRTPAKAAAHAAEASTPANANAISRALQLAFDACIELRSYAAAKGHSLTFDCGDVRALASTIYIQANRG